MDFFTPETDRKNSEAEPDAQTQLPYVLLIGDSISQGYTQPVRELLTGRCNVDRPRTNCGDTRRGLECIDEWLGDRQWDLVHFNWGLHDFCYRHPDSKVYGNRDKEKGTISVELDQYGENLEKLVKRMKRSAKQLVWASSTYVPPGEAGRFQGDDLRYNAVADEVMARYNIPVNDLHAMTSQFDPGLFTCPGDVHYTPEGLLRIAEAVARRIEQHLFGA